jgi:hypothetical protein
MAAKKTTKIRPWTKDDVRTLKTLARDGTQTTVIARKLKRTLGATRQRAFQEVVSLATGVGKTAVCEYVRRAKVVAVMGFMIRSGKKATRALGADECGDRRLS